MPPRSTPSRTSRAVAATELLDRLEAAHPEATCALDYRTPFELVVATILSAQCTDKRVNEVTPGLFAHYPGPAALAAANPAALEEEIRPTGFFRAKTRSLQGCARRLVEHHGGEVPAQMDALVKLPGVGRKTANVVLGHAFGRNEGIAVDTHVLRVSNRLGLARADTPEDTERQLMDAIPRERWTRTSDLLIFHGRKVCQALRPACGSCPAFDLCRWLNREAVALTGRVPKARTAAARKPAAKRRRATAPRQPSSKRGNTGRGSATRPGHGRKTPAPAATGRTRKARA
ncbi:MAG: endonuclease III [Vicinamibacteria bacterium]